MLCSFARERKSSLDNIHLKCKKVNKAGNFRESSTNYAVATCAKCPAVIAPCIKRPHLVETLPCSFLQIPVCRSVEHIGVGRLDLKPPQKPSPGGEGGRASARSDVVVCEAAFGCHHGQKVPYTTSVICSFLANASFSSRRSLWRRNAARGGLRASRPTPTYTTAP